MVNDGFVPDQRARVSPDDTEALAAAVDEFELALARLDWASAACCLDLPGQADALRWHVTACDAALAALPPGNSSRTGAA